MSTGNQLYQSQYALYAMLWSEGNPSHNCQWFHFIGNKEKVRKVCEHLLRANNSNATIWVWTKPSNRAISTAPRKSSVSKNMCSIKHHNATAKLIHEHQRGGKLAQVRFSLTNTCNTHTQALQLRTTSRILMRSNQIDHSSLTFFWKGQFCQY